MLSLLHGDIPLPFFSSRNQKVAELEKVFMWFFPPIQVSSQCVSLKFGYTARTLSS